MNEIANEADWTKNAYREVVRVHGTHFAQALAPERRQSGSELLLVEEVEPRVGCRRDSSLRRSFQKG